MEDKKEGWINTGLKPEWEFVEGVKTSDEGMTVDPAYLYHEPIETPIERYARKHGYRLNLKTNQYESLWVGEGKVLRPEPGPNIDIVTEDGDVLLKKENVPKRFWKKVFGLSDAELERRKG